MKSPPTSVPGDPRPRRAEDAHSRSPGPRSPSTSPGLKWPGLTTAQSLAVAAQFGVSVAVGVGLGVIAGQWAGRSGPYGPPVHAARSLRRTHPWHDQCRCVVSSNPAFQRARVARGIARKGKSAKTLTGVADLEEAHDRIS